MTFSRRDFLLAGSAASALWLTGCGGGGSADGAPKATTSTGTTGTSGSCSITQATTGIDAPTTAQQKLVFSNVTGFADSGVDFTLGSNVQSLYHGCTNQIVSGSEGMMQELFVSTMQTLAASDTSSGKLLVRNLRLHLSIPHDTSGAQLQSGYTFSVGDPTSSTACEVFSGTLIVSDPSAASGGTWAYQIVSGSVQIVGTFGTVVPLAYLKLSNVVATASAAGVGSGINQASSSDQVEMNGYLYVPFEPLTTVIYKKV